MSYQIENEVRIMLSKQEYDSLIKKYYDLGREISNTNYYLDSPTFSLKKSSYMLRIRHINSINYELTIKIKGSNGDIEINQNISREEKDNIIQNQAFPNGEVKNFLLEKKFNLQEIKQWGQSKTIRKEIPYKESLIVIDKNFFADIIDYNLEIESKSMEQASELLKALIDENNIKDKKSDYLSKSSRAYLYFKKH